ncbi:conserved hypothetical protein [uncultured Dysgonomonas sp.]|uniref:Uncharacterized protein n=1 Tax=uncultured Dysgonomonas sp. TaxID=206096 RepID=A0A212IZ86_9BACT|nr:conserved hypothetical protein [uncultured Dysgonomonas sp.]
MNEVEYKMCKQMVKRLTALTVFLSAFRAIMSFYKGTTV